MRLYINLVLTLLVSLPIFSTGQTFIYDLDINDLCLSEEEKAVYDMINKYRKTRALPEIALSHSLTYVAKVHARDLAMNKVESEKCNMHSWSDKGEWSPCCYTPDHKESECMWFKPRELTNYSGYGYEIAFFSSYQYDTIGAYAKDAIDQWSKSRGHNSVILNLGIWKNIKWQAIGVGIYNGYATVWFGEDKDQESPVGECQ